MPLPPTVSCSSKIQIGFTFLVPAHLGSPGQRAVKRMYVCIYRTRKAETTVSSIMLAASSGKRLCNGTVSIRPSARLSVPSTASDSDVHLVCRSSSAGSRCRSVAPGTDRYLGSRRPSCSVRESVCNNSKQNVKSHVFLVSGESLKCKKRTSVQFQRPLNHSGL